MEFAIINRKDNDIALDEWEQIICSHKMLQEVPPIEGMNPFTGERVGMDGRGVAYVVVDGKKIGNITLEEGQLMSASVPDCLCEELSELLNADLHEIDLNS